MEEEEVDIRVPPGLTTGEGACCEDAKTRNFGDFISSF